MVSYMELFTLCLVVIGIVGLVRGSGKRKYPPHVQM